MLPEQSDSGNATDIRVSEDPNFLINMSVWATIEPPGRTDAAGIHVQSALPAARGAGQPAGHETRTVLRRLALIPTAIDRHGTQTLAQGEKVERVMGIEPTLAAWEAAVLPLNYTRTGGRFYGPPVAVGKCAAHPLAGGPLRTDSRCR